MPKIVFKGTVFSGNGEGRKFIELPWVKQQIQEKLGFTPYAGTLNIRLAEDSVKQKKLLQDTKGIEVYPERGYYSGLLIKAYMGILECAIVIPQVPNYPSNVMEIIAPVYLRERLKIADDSEVTVTVNV